MTDAIPTLDGTVQLVAEGGANGHAEHSTIEGFRLALRLGATALAAKAWLTADGELVVARSDVLGGVRRRRIGAVRREALPDSVPTVAELYDECGAAPLVISVADDDAFAALVDVATAHDGLDGLWVRHDETETLARWRNESERLHLVNTVRIPTLKEGPERRIATLREHGIDAIEARFDEWNGGLVALAHRFRRQARATDANYPDVIRRLVRNGLDAIGGDHPDRLVDALV